MNFQKTSFTLWLIVCFASLSFLGGCGRPVVSLHFPLANGNAWTYQGTVTYKLGKQDQPMPPLTFSLVCKQVGGKKSSSFELTLQQDKEPIWSVQLVPTPKGILNPLTGQIWIPNKIKMRKKWKITLNGDTMTPVVRSQTTTTVPAGTFPAYLVNFKGPKTGETGSIWLNPDVGAVALSWTRKTPGAESTTRLELSSYTFP